MFRVIKEWFRSLRTRCRHCDSVVRHRYNGPDECLRCRKSQLMSPALYEILKDKDKARQLCEDIRNG